ncbi:hypothetical protein CDL12_01925 [Handroanthus impetiginosus]|uniref:WRKY domain-containing protein n=1 Tax=Handroanthus impetiginosus TaxID=429701 RepID=A0A2G9I6G4_9LAMI|nr:hypothetical protein CDL12_01925 [Handroanthus impetiginosus]
MQEENHLKAAKLKMDRVREENERLKLTLSQVMKDYHSLKMQFNDIVQEDHPKKISTDSDPSDDESEFVSLRLGRFSGDLKLGKKKRTSYNENKSAKKGELDGLELGLDCKSCVSNSTQVSKNLKPEKSFDESREEGNFIEEFHKRAKASTSGCDDILLHSPLKKPRVSVRTVCNTQTMNDGCQWRKYGQKIAKGNPCPRAYYRCTVSSSCPVRKQVQRCMNDMTILTTTYEGTHNHPLPPAASTMASATSAAVAMLNCSSTASPPVHGGSATSATTSPSLLGFNFTSKNPTTNSHFPTATISSSQSHPTVILDLTHDNKFSSSLFSNIHTHSSPMSLNFSSFNNPWEGKFSTFSQPSVYNNSIHASHNDHKIAVATKDITCDSTFQSVLAAAITSYFGSNVDGKSSSFSQPWRNFLNKFTQPMDSQQKN